MSEEEINKVQEEEQEEKQETKLVLKKEDIRLKDVNLSANKR